MAIKKFNSIDGFSVGSDTLISVIDSVANVNANSLVVSNKSNLGNVGNITITGGSAGYVLKTDGTGNLSWGVDTATAGGNNSYVQYNEGGTLAGNSNFTFDQANSVLTVTGNIVSNNANLGNLVEANYFVGNGSQITGLSLNDSQFVDVSTMSPTLGQLLGYNGTYWTNVDNTGTVSAGAGVDFWLSTPIINTVNANNSIQIDSLSTSPNTSAQTYANIAVNGTAAIAGFVSPVLGRTVFDAGNWDFSIWANISSTGGTNTINAGIHEVLPNVATVTTTGTGTSRTVTASSGTPFANVVAGSNVILSSYVQTPQGMYRVTAKTSDTVVTINTPTTYTNETSVTADVWVPLFNIGSATLSTTSLFEYLFGTTQPEYVVSTTSAIGLLLAATTSSNKNIYVTINGTNQASHFATPLHTLHDDLAGLQGGTANQYYHLTSTEYTGTGTGTFVRQISANLTTPNIDSATGTSLVLSGNITSDNAHLGNVAIANYFTGTLTTASQPNITSLGTLSNLSVTGNISAGNISGGNLITANYFTGVITTTHQPYIESLANLVGLTVSNVYGLVDFNTTANVSLGNISNLHILGGSAGYVLKTDGSGNLSWGIDTAAAGGSNRDVQFNDGGSLGGNSNFTFDKSTAVLTLTGNIITNNANLGNLATANYFSGNGALLTYITGSNVSGNVSSAIQSHYANIANSVAGANVSGQVSNALIAGTVYTNSQPNITSLGTLTSLDVTGNLSAGNITGGNLVSANYFSGNGSLLSSITGANVTGNVSWAITSNYANTANSISGSNVSGNVADAIHAYYADVANSISGSNVNGNVSWAITSNWANIANNVAGANVSGQVSNALIAGTVYTNSQPNITSVGTLTSLDVSGNATITGNLTVSGTTEYINVTNLYVKDPIIELGGGANGAPLTTNDGKDRGTLLHYYTTGTVDAFMGWDNSNGEFGFGSNVSVTNEVVTWNSYGNIRAGYFIGDGSLLANINAANIVGAYSNANVAAYLPTYTGNVSANYFIGNGSTITYITGANVNGNVSSAIQAHYANIANSVSGSNVSGNVSWAITSNWANTANSVSGSNVSGNVSDAIHAYYADVANSVSGSNVSGNVSWAITSNWANTANSVTGSNVSGQVSNALIAGTVYTNAQPNITSLGNLSSLTVTGISDLGSVSNVKITGGSTGYVLTTDGYGDLSWEPTSNSGPGFVSIRKDNFVGDGIQTSFSLITVPNGEDAVEVNLNGLIQQSYVYDIVGSNVVFTSPPVSGANIEVTTFGALSITQTDEQILFIDGNSLAGTNNFTFTRTTNTLSTTNLSVSANISAGNVKSDNLLYANGIPYNFTTSAGGLNTEVQFNDSNVFAGSANFTFNKTTNTLSVTNIIANGSGITYITGSNVSGQVGNSLIAGTVYTNAQPNITSVGTLTSLNVSGNATIAGNLTVSGNINYINVESLVVQDPIIELGGGANGAPLTTNDGKDRGSLLHYYTTSPVDAFMGWDNSNGEFAFGSNVSVSNEVVTFNNFGNIRANYFIGDGSLLANINAANIVGSYGNTNVAAYLPTYTGNLVSLTGAVTTTANVTANYFIGNGSLLTGLPESYSNTNVAAYLPTYTGNVSANYFIGNGSTLTYITGANVSGNVSWAITSNWANVANSVSGSNVSGNVTDAVHAYYADTANSVSGSNVSGNVNDAIHAYYADIANSVSGSNVSGNVSWAITSNWANVANSVSGSNVSGNVADAVHAYYSDVANSVSGSNVSGNVSWAITSNWSNIANSVSGSNVSGNVSDAIHAYYADVANSVSGSNVSGQVSNALIAGTVYTNAQPNITSVGTLANLAVTGNISAGNAVIGTGSGGNITGANLISANYFSGDGSLLTNLNSANIGNVANANYANYAGTAFEVSGGNVSGQVGNALIAGTVYTNAQPNITSLGNLTSLTVVGLSDLGPASNLKITGGSAGYVLTTNGLGDVTWQTSGAGVGPGFVNIIKNSFVGNGSQTVFTLTTVPAGEESLLINIDGITQQDSAYTLTGANVTFSSPPLNGEVIEITTYGSISIGSNSTVLFNDNGNIGNVANFTFNKSSDTLFVTNIDTSSISFDAGIITVSGSNAGVFSSGVSNVNLGLAANVTVGSSSGNTTIQGNLLTANINTTGNLSVSNTAIITNLKVNDFYSNRTPVSVTTNTIVDSFSVNKYRSAKYTMRINSDDGYQAVEVLLIHDGSDSYVTIYGSLSTIGTDIVTLTSNVNSGNVRLLATTGSANTTVNLVGTYVAD